MIRLSLIGVRVEVPTNQPIVLLREEEGTRFLPIFIGSPEATAIVYALQGLATPRPLTHDLMANIFKGFGIAVERVIISELKNSTYYARLILQEENELGRKIVEIDARPSDCLAIATAQKRPIYVSANLFEKVEDMSEILNRINENESESE